MQKITIAVVQGKNPPFSVVIKFRLSLSYFSKGDASRPTFFSHNHIDQVIYTVVPSLALTKLLNNLYFTSVGVLFYYPIKRVKEDTMNASELLENSLASGTSSWFERSFQSVDFSFPPQTRERVRMLHKN